jgi:hypothetical protein
MKLQAIGKIRLALSPFEPQWANVPLYLTARGLTTSPVPHPSGEIFDVDVDFHDHLVNVRTGGGLVESVELRARPVSEFYVDLHRALTLAGVDAPLSERPSEVTDPIPFPEDRVHASYDPDAAHRFWRAMLSMDVVMREHRARFRGKASPVQFYWGTFDLAFSLFSGRSAEPPKDAGVIMRLGADAEQVCAGWWPGDERVPEPTFFAYAYPQPSGIDEADVRPETARWDESIREFLLPYEAVRTAADPRQTLLDFLASTQEAAMNRASWPSELVAG